MCELEQRLLLSEIQRYGNSFRIVEVHDMPPIADFELRMRTLHDHSLNGSLRRRSTLRRTS